MEEAGGRVRVRVVGLGGVVAEVVVGSAAELAEGFSFEGADVVGLEVEVSGGLVDGARGVAF